MDEDDIAGFLAAVDTDGRHEPIEQIAEETQNVESTTTEETNTNTQNETNIEEVSEETPTEQQTTEGTEATQETESEPLKTEIDDSWRNSLPQRPADYAGPAPEIDQETGQITNMTPEQFYTWQQETTMARFRQEQHDNTVMSRALDEAEKVLPEMKTNQAVRTLVENAVTASVLAGKQIDSFDAAVQVREALGFGPEKIAQAKAEATQNAKTHIEVQKVAAVETSSNTQESDTTDKVKNLQSRIRKGDDEAFAELLGVWSEAGVIN